MKDLAEVLVACIVATLIVAAYTYYKGGCSIQIDQQVHYFGPPRDLHFGGGAGKP